MLKTEFKPRRRKCKNPDCRAEYMTQRPMQTVCSPACGLVIAKAKAVKDAEAKRKMERASIREAKQRLKTLADHMKEAQQAFNAFIRERDHALPCVSCGRHHQGQWHAGHYRTTAAAPELRFEPLNVAKQCQPCNCHKSGDLINYRMELVRRIGADKVDWLEGPHEPKKYTIDDLIEIKRKYRAMARELAKKRQGISQ